MLISKYCGGGLLHCLIHVADLGSQRTGQSQTQEQHARPVSFLINIHKYGSMPYQTGVQAQMTRRQA